MLYYYDYYDHYIKHKHKYMYSQFNLIYFKSDWGRTIKVPVPYPTPSVEGYTRTPSHDHSCSTMRAEIISLRTGDVVVPKLFECGCHGEW